VSHSTQPVEGRNQRYSHVGMPDKPISSRTTDASNRRPATLHKVLEFPNPSRSTDWDTGMMIIFELDRRFAIDLVVTELNQKPGDVIPIRRKRKGKSASRPRPV
jgi:hypothetical protein